MEILIAALVAVAVAADPSGVLLAWEDVPLPARQSTVAPLNGGPAPDGDYNDLIVVDVSWQLSGAVTDGTF